MPLLYAQVLFGLMTFFGASHAETVASQNETITSDAQLRADFAWEVEKAKHIGPPEGMGYMWPGNPSLPEAVSRASESVFTIVAPDGDSRIVENPEKGLREVESSDLSWVEKEILKEQLSACLKFPKKVCTILDGFKTSSAYVTGDGKDLRTALHAVESLAGLHLRGKLQGDLPLYILKDGRLIAGPEDLKARFVKVRAEDLRMMGQRTVARAGSADQVLIRLEKKLAEPLVIATSKERAGEALFIIGTPKKTQDRQQFGVTDSDGKHTWISRGKALSPEQIIYRSAKLTMFVSQARAVEQLKYSVITSADSAPGISGGAIVNARGEVLATLASGTPYNEVHPQTMSFGARLAK